MPNARVKIAVTAKPGLLRSARIARRRSWSVDSGQRIPCRAPEFAGLPGDRTATTGLSCVFPMQHPFVLLVFCWHKTGCRDLVVVPRAGRLGADAGKGQR